MKGDRREYREEVRAARREDILGKGRMEGWREGPSRKTNVYIYMCMYATDMLMLLLVRVTGFVQRFETGCF